MEHAGVRCAARLEPRLTRTLCLLPAQGELPDHRVLLLPHRQRVGHRISRGHPGAVEQPQEETPAAPAGGAWRGGSAGGRSRRSRRSRGGGQRRGLGRGGRDAGGGVRGG